MLNRDIYTAPLILPTKQNTMRHTRDTLFATRVEVFREVGIDLPRLRAQCQQLLSRSEQVNFSNDGGQQSSPHTDPHKLPALFDALRKMTLVPGYRVRIDNYWINVNRFGDSNTPHVHPAADFSASFYVDVPPGPCGEFMVYDPRPSAAFNLFNQIDSYSVYRYRPREDMLIVFPAWLSHSVSSNRTEQERVSIAFNMTVTDRA